MSSLAPLQPEYIIACYDAVTHALTETFHSDQSLIADDTLDDLLDMNDVITAGVREFIHFDSPNSAFPQHGGLLFELDYVASHDVRAEHGPNWVMPGTEGCRMLPPPRI